MPVRPCPMTACAPSLSGRAGAVTTAKNIRNCCARRLKRFSSPRVAALFRWSCQQRVQRFTKADQSKRLAENGNALEFRGALFRSIREVARHQKKVTRKLWAVFAQPPQHFHTVSAGHFQVAKYNVKLFGIEL